MQMSNVILEPIPFNINHQQMTTGCTTILRLCNQSSLIVIDDTNSHETVPQMTRPIAQSSS